MWLVIDFWSLARILINPMIYRDKVNQVKKSTSFDFRPQAKADSAATTTQATITQAATTVQHATNSAKATSKQTTLGQKSWAAVATNTQAKSAAE